MRILLVNDSHPDRGWGAETYLRRLADGLRAAGDEVAILAGEVEHRGVGKVRDVWDPAARRLVRSRARGFRADIVHHHNVLRELSVSVLGVPEGTPTVLTVHDLRLLGALEHTRRDPRALPARIKSRVDRRVARRTVDAALAVSEPIADALRAAGFRQVRTVPVPVEDPDVPPCPPQDCTDVVYAGRLTHDKGVDVLLEAFGHVARTRPWTRLVIAGDGHERGDLQRAARSLGGQVQFVGRLASTELSALLGQARVVVVPSIPARRPEGSPLIVAEAAIHGRPVIASADPGLLRMLESLECGLAVQPGSVAQLADALSVLLDDPAMAARLGARAAVTAAARHGVDAVTAATRSAYAELLAAA